MRKAPHEKPGSRTARWYSLNVRDMRARNIILPLLVVALLCLVSERHVWTWSWQSGPYAMHNCRAVPVADGGRREAWRWVEGGEIRVYVPTYLHWPRAKALAAAVRSLSQEVGLNVFVRMAPIDERISAAIRRNSVRIEKQSSLDFDAFSRDLAATRDGAYAEMVILPGMIDAAPKAVGAAYFSYGVAVLNDQCASPTIARHETAHLLGYSIHDTWPLVIFGYPNGAHASGMRNGEGATLMLAEDAGYDLSPRAHDALVSFWRGLERRTGKHFFLEPGAARSGGNWADA